VAGPDHVHAGYALHEGHTTEEFQLIPGAAAALTAATVAMPVLTPPAPAPAAGPAAGPLRMWDDTLTTPAVRADDVGVDGPPEAGRIAWLMLVPVLAALLVAPSALGAFQATRHGTIVATVVPSGALPAGDPVRLGLREYASRALLDRGASVAERRIVLTGFLIDGPNGEPYLARMVVGCCAADARPVKVGLTGDVPADLEPDTWLEVEGHYVEHADRDPLNGGLIPYLQVTKANPIAAPAHPYES
jgi:uncharacterized repeat protein (TIGR03943 family)